MDPGFNGGGETVGNPTPNMDRIARKGLVLASASPTPSCSPSRASIMTGQNPLHHGILRPPMYNEPGGLDGMVTLAGILQQLGYYTQGIGKWHMGENEGSMPQNVGFDDYYGFLGVSDMYTEWRDVYFNPEVALSPARFKMMEKLGFNHNNVHCKKGKKAAEDTYLIDLKIIRNLDQDWANYGEKFLRDKARRDQPWFLYYCTRGCHFDNYPNPKYAGKSPARTVFSDAMVEVDEVFGRLVAARGDRPAGEHDHHPHVRQRTGRRNSAARPQPARRQGFVLGRRRACAHLRLLGGCNLPAEVGRAIRSG